MKKQAALSAEEKRLCDADEGSVQWRQWGPYLSERAWGTVREDYSPDGSAWTYFPHDHARSRAYRWNEDGLLGFCDAHQRLCFSLALWNGKDPILKERLFGLDGNEGNHGEDVKEVYYYLDATPTYSYVRMLYKYPQAEYPYLRLIEENRLRKRSDPEFELIDTGIFDGDRYFDVYVEYAKAAPDDIYIRITIENHGPENAPIRIIPTIWFRNRWTWFGTEPDCDLRQIDGQTIAIESGDVSIKRLYVSAGAELIFTNNETNNQRLFNAPNLSDYVKDAFHRYIINGEANAVNPQKRGTKAAAVYQNDVAAGQKISLCLRLTAGDFRSDRVFADFDKVFSDRIAEAEEFYARRFRSDLSSDARLIQRQAFAGLLCSKQFYHYVVRQWLEGDPAMPKPPEERKRGRNHDWLHIFNADVISMPDKWEYPWYAAWDLAFHCVAMAPLDPKCAKEQLVLMLREWYMHPNGQIPAYEWAFSDVNPPVHAWAAMRVFQIERKRTGRADRKFLEKVFHKLLLNFTWWVNRKDTEGMNIFEGGFLGLDNIGVFDRSRPLPTGGRLAQADATGWMAMYCLNMLAIALELAKEDDVYEDLATKFLEHFILIADAMNHLGSDGISLWDEEDGFYYDVVHLHGEKSWPLKIRSLVGLTPIFAVATIEPDLLARLERFQERMNWFFENRLDLRRTISCFETPGEKQRRLLAIADRPKLERVLAIMLDENEFLSPFGIRSLSKIHLSKPYEMRVNGEIHRVDYEPAESTSGFFGGNSNWRGPVWFPVNFLLIESLQKFHHYYGDDFRVECPTGSGNLMNLWEVSIELERRLSRLFLRGDNGRRPCFGDCEKMQKDPYFRDNILFYEYFDGDNGRGCGAAHQTGWTALIAKILEQCGV